MSVTRPVPGAVPSVTHSSLPWASEPVKKMRPFETVAL
jgi:hypothetical protein